MTKMFLLLFVIFVSCHGFLLDGNAQTETSVTSLDDKRYNRLMDLLTEERHSRSKLEAAVARELLALGQEIAKCQCANGNGGHTEAINQGSLSNDTKTLEEEIIHLKRDQALLQTQVAGLIQNNTVLKDKVMQLEQNLTTLRNADFSLDFRNETSHLEKALQITNNNLNAVINDANARKHNFSVMSQKVAVLMQNGTVLKDNILQFERNLSAMEKTKCCLNFRNDTSQLEKALQITNNKLSAVANDVDARKQDFIALYQKVQSTEQRLENNTKSLEASQNMTFLKLQKEIINGDQMLQNKTETMKANQNITYREIKQEYTHMFSEAKLAEQNLSDRTKLLEMRENSTSLKLQQQTVLLQQELNKMSNRVTMTTYKGGADAKNGVIQFTDVKIVNGIHNIDSIKNSGIFTCENPGLYLISVYIKTNTNIGRYFVNKNTNGIADGMSSITDHYQTTSVTVLVQLTVNDTISVTGSLHVYGGYASCLTILQIQ